MAHQPTKEWWSGLVLGLLFGVMGNFFVAYFMKYFDTLGLAPWAWGVGALCWLAVLAWIVWTFWKRFEEAPA